MSTKIIPVVVAVVFDKQGQVLIAKRPHSVHLGGYWEFPGGKIESGEVPFAALKRELKEEVGITINNAKELMTIDQQYDDRIVTLDVWQTSDYDGIAQSCEGQSIRWVPLEQLSTICFPDVNYKIIERISLPEFNN